MSLALSVLIPVYNVQDYLEQCLDSVLAQTFADMEIICIDDGSIDASPRILERFAERDRRLRVISKPNSGYGATLNRGLAEAKGEYVAILESDDFLDLGAYAALMEAAIAEDADVVRANYWKHWSSPKPRDVLERVVPRELAGRHIEPLAHPQVFDITPSIWGSVYRREMLDGAGIRFLATPGASYQDTSFAFKVWASARRAFLLNEAFVHYRQDNEGSSVNSKGKAYCVIEEFAEVERFIAEGGGRLEVGPTGTAMLKPIATRLKLLAYLWNLDRLSPDLRPDFLMAAREELQRDVNAGRLDERLYAPWHLAELKSLLGDPLWFLTIRAARDKGPANRARYYFELGGFPLMLKAAAHAAGRR